VTPADFPEKPVQFIEPSRVLSVMAEHAHDAIVERHLWQNFMLAVMAGAFICAGALFSVLLSSGVEAEGPASLLLGLGFSTGFFFVILSKGVLFTEVNVLVPAQMLKLGRIEMCRRVAAFWLLAAIGNIVGALLLSLAIQHANPVHGQALETLAGLVAKKMSYFETGGAGAWFSVVLSGILANWLVGMAAFFALMGRTIIGRYIPVFLAVSLFVAANFQHSPANAGYFALAMSAGIGLQIHDAFLWNLLPAAIGNIIGAITLVAIPFHFAFQPIAKRSDS